MSAGTPDATLVETLLRGFAALAGFSLLFVGARIRLLRRGVPTVSPDDLGLD